MKIEEVEGIVLSEVNYNDSSKILNVLTKEYGLIGIMSKGSRNIKSKLRAVSRKLIYAKFYIYYKKDKISTLISVDLINSFNEILLDLTKISYASLIIDLVYQVVKQNDDKKVFDILRDGLIKINEGYAPNILTDIIKIKLLDYLGVSPIIDFCSNCGTTQDIITISAIDGGYVCRKCYTNQEIVSQKCIKLIRMFYYVDIKNITKLDISNEVVKEVEMFLDDYYDRYTGIYLKSREFLNKIAMLNDK